MPLYKKNWFIDDTIMNNNALGKKAGKSEIQHNSNVLKKAIVCSSVE